jgi:Replication-relaxation
MSRKPSSKRVVFTKRDVQLLVSLVEYRYLSTKQAERLHFPSLATAVRRLRLLARAGFVELFCVPSVGERLIALREAGAKVAADSMGRSLEEIWSPRREQPKDALFLKHFLAAGDFRIALTTSCVARSGIRLLGFLPEHLGRRSSNGSVEKVLRDSVAHGDQPDNRLAHCPDAAFALGRENAAALFFLEIDRGTEVLSDEERGLGKTIRFYLQYLLSGGYQRYREHFGSRTDFKLFRVLLVTSSQLRLQNIRRRCGAIPFQPASAKRFIWLGHEELLQSNRILEHPWVSLDPSDTTQYRIAPSAQETGGRQPWQSP